MAKINNFKADDAVLVVIIVLLIFLLIRKHWFSSQADSNLPRELGISKLMEKVRTELYQSEEERLKTNAGALFKLDKFDLEINFIVKSSDTTNVGIELEPVTVGGQTEVSSEKIQKITLHMIAPTAQEYKQSAEDKPIEGEDIIEHGPRPPNKKGNNP